MAELLSPCATLLQPPPCAPPLPRRLSAIHGAVAQQNGGLLGQALLHRIPLWRSVNNAEGVYTPSTIFGQHAGVLTWKPDDSCLFAPQKGGHPRCWTAPIPRPKGIMASLVTAALEVQEDPVITASKDLLIIGPGVLGKLVAGLWMKEFPGCSVVGQTATTNHHEELQSLGIKPLLKGNQSEKGFPFVMFCAPPSGSLDYAGELRLAAEQWNGQGVLLFTSSSAVYNCADNGECDEDTPIVNLGQSPRTDVLLRAEQEVLQVGGNVVRLAGLYTKERGPHAYWAKKGIVDARPDHILNLIHYEDAASLCVTILKKGFHKDVFMGCDNHPLSRQEVMNIVNESGKFEDKFEAFTGIDGPLGKKMNCNRTRSKTGWQPKYKSFTEFIHFVA